MPGFDHRRLQAFCEGVLGGVGLSAAHASIVARSLVEANLRGVDSHGVMRLPIYVRRMEAGLINVRPQLRLERAAPGAANLDGDDGPGQVGALEGMRAAVGLAREAGIGVVVIRNSNHFGAAAFFALEAVRSDMVGVCLTHAEADVIPFGGRFPMLGTNPVAVALPSAGEFPVVLDMATSIVSIGKVMMAAAEDKEIPADWAVDANGEVCTDPSLARAVRPMAGAKGYGLALVIDALAALLSGAPFGVHIRRMYDDFSAPQRISHVTLALDPGRFVPVDEFKTRMSEMVAELRAAAPAEGFEEVMVPGDVEARTERKRRSGGIPLSDALAEDLRELGVRYGVEL